MDMIRLREDFDSLDSQNVETLTNDMKTACPVLDNVENVVNITKSYSDHLREADERDLSLSQENVNDNSFEKISRRPVETWKYMPFPTECNRMSYKCSLCCSVYQHKKSLNKHWKDKHLANGASPTPFQERVPSNIVVTPSMPFQNSNTNIYPSVGSSSGMLSIKREMYLPQIIVSNTEVDDSYRPMNRKRLSLQINEADENKENNALPQPKRMSLLPMQSLMLRQNRNLDDHNKRTTMTGESSTKLDICKPDTGPLDLRTSKLYLGQMINYRCFQCVFHTNSIIELNEHFTHLHVSILMGVKSFCLPMSVYQQLLLNQFSAIVRTKSEPLETFNGPMNCNLCNCQMPTRYDIIHHMGLAHELDMIWVCLVCGFGCRFPAQLSHHFRSHSEITMLTTSVTIAEPPLAVNRTNCSIDYPLPTPDSHLATSTPNNKSKRIPSKKDQSSSDNCSGKEKPLKCLVCDATARWRSELFTHMITHSEHRSFGCKFCSYRSKWKWDVPKHLKRCRMAPPSVRKPDVQNSYLITLLQHYLPPPGDILHEFMKQYNIKDIGSLTKTMGIKMENEENIPATEQSSSSMNADKKSQSEVGGKTDTTEISKDKYDKTSTVSEDDGELDVGTDHFFEDSTDKSEQSVKSLFKKCPWCQDFSTNKPHELGSHLAEHHCG